MLTYDDVTTDRATHIRTRAHLGADLLDARRPGWYTVINLDTLHLSESLRCVLGQLFGEYDAGLYILHNTDGTDRNTWLRDRLDDAEAWAIERGFFAETSLTLYCPDNETLDERSANEAWRVYDRAVAAEYRELTEAWRGLIVERRAVSACRVHAPVDRL